jgi:hypothetical protein
MTKAIWLSCALAALVAWTPAARADEHAGDPDAIARACVGAATRTANRCVAANDKTADVTVRRVKVLLAAGHQKRARKVAAEGISAIRKRSGAAVRSIRTRCAKCVRLLVKLGRPRLAHRVKEACDGQAARVRVSQARSVKQIQAALGGK